MLTLQRAMDDRIHPSRLHAVADWHEATATLDGRRSDRRHIATAKHLRRVATQLKAANANTRSQRAA